MMHKNPKHGRWEALGMIVRGPDSPGKVFFVFDREFIDKVERLEDWPPLIDLTLGSDWRFNHRRGKRWYFCRHRFGIVAPLAKSRQSGRVRNIRTIVDLSLWLPQGPLMWNPRAMHPNKPWKLRRNEIVTIKGLA